MVHYVISICICPAALTLAPVFQCKAIITITTEKIVSGDWKFPFIDTTSLMNFVQIALMVWQVQLQFLGHSDSFTRQ